MTDISQNIMGRRDLAEFILDLSYRISVYSPPMKPYVRFCEQEKPSGKWRAFYPDHFWDFDDHLQKTLLGLLKSIVDDEEIEQLYTERFIENLGSFYDQQKRLLENAVKHNIGYETVFRARDNYILKRVKPGSRMLYAGCGSGTECISFAEKGLDVTGIDTNQDLVDVANGWADHLGLSFRALCMDMMNHTLEPGVFDSIVLEFYGSWSSETTTSMARQKLAVLLKPDGMGFIVAQRRKYASYWYMMRHRFSPAMAKWLIPQTRLDFIRSGEDACEERLFFGLYNRCHSKESLAAELADIFDVQECTYESYDPRYVIAVVRRKEDFAPGDTADGMPADDTRREISKGDLAHVHETLLKIADICDMLEQHAKEVDTFFKTKGKNQNPLACVKTDLVGFADLVNDVYEKCGIM